MQKIICKLLDCNIPERKPSFEDLTPYLKIVVIKRLCESIAVIIGAIVLSIILSSVQTTVLLLLLALMYTGTSLFFYYRILYGAYKFVDCECMGITKNIFGKRIQFLKKDDYTYCLPIEKKPYTKGSIIRVYMHPNNIRKDADGLYILSSPLLVQVLKRNIDTDDDDNQKKKKKKLGIFNI